MNDFSMKERPDIFELFRKEHASIMGLLRELTYVPLRSRDQLMRQTRHILNQHMLTEERFLYPLLSRNRDMQPLHRSGIDEHGRIKDAWASLQETEADHEWYAILRELKHEVGAHLRREEDVIFPAAEACLPREYLEEIAARLSVVDLPTPDRTAGGTTKWIAQSKS